jgi:hypothetical protein
MVGKIQEARMVKAIKLLLVVSFSFINITPTAFNRYSPELVMQGSQLVMYSGGWNVAGDVPHDAIFRQICTTITNCGTVTKVLDPAPMYQINDPTIVQMPDNPSTPANDSYLIMYYTCSDGYVNNVCYSTSWTGTSWSTPTVLIYDYWLPSAISVNGEIYLYATYALGSALIYKFDLGTSGVSVGGPEQIYMPTNTGYYWVNVSVRYYPSINMCQMVAENLAVDSSTFVDYLYSYDCSYFSMGQSHIIDAASGSSVRTPAMHPSTAYYLYFGCSTTRDGMSNKICFEDWSP